MMRCELFCTSSPVIRESFKETWHKIAKFVDFLFRALGLFFSGQFDAFYWTCKNYKHLKEIHPFCFKPPHFSEPFEDPFPELATAYKTLQKLDESSFKKDINRQLKKGFCHAYCLALISLIRQNKSSIQEELPNLPSISEKITLLQILEMFRECFQEYARADLIEKTFPFSQEGFSKEIYYFPKDVDLKNALINDFAKENGLVALRLGSHTLLLELNSKYSFYNSNSGCYEYATLEEFVKALLEHIDSHIPESDLSPRWSFSFYNL